MARTAYVNGRYIGIDDPAVAVEDRGYQFADGVYEVIKAIHGRPLDLERHLDRLERSLGELALPLPMSRGALKRVIAETLRRNRLRRAIIYLQVTRGVAPRNHLFPKEAAPSLVVTVRRAPFPSRAEREDGVGVISLPDQRWGRCDIKSIALLPNLLAKQEAHEAGCREAWLVDAEGRVTEGSSSNAYIIDRDGRLVTHPLGPAILGGITRSVLLELAREDGIEVVERPFSLEEAKAAREALMTSTSSLVLPVVRIDDRAIGNGRPGSITTRLQALYLAREGLGKALS